ncbi:RNA polymerase factor sigma-54 [bacterium]|jgi:RNA polymerase sigma-54 factor|nr:RNA polymerase factor sigma-54 [bacterium]
MQYELGQIQSQQQKLMMSPQMRQALEILQLPLLELRTIIQQQIQSNPVLEIEENAEKTDAEETEPEDTPDKIEELDFKEEFDSLVSADEEMKEYFKSSGEFKKYSNADKERRDYLASLITRPETFEEYLEFQLNIMLDSDKEKTIGKIIIGNLDKNGYLKASLEELAKESSESEPEVSAVLSKIRQFDPPGIAASNIKECLLIQVERKGIKNKTVESIINGNLELLGKKQFDKISKDLDVSINEIREAEKIISSLNPKPAISFEQAEIPYISPDVTIEKTDDGFEVILNDEYIPHIKISNFYKKSMQDESTPKNIKQYIREKISEGKWLIKNIYQRQQTLYNIATEILSCQLDFFERGPKSLKPMVLQNISSRLNIHESTVSRAINSKYLQCSWGLYPIKYFFTSSLNTASGETVSAQRAKELIREIVSSEDKSKPYSDDAIAEMVKKEGIDVARRTVAKYREEAGIYSSRMRKRY